MTAYDAAVLALSPSAYWKLDEDHEETSGPWVDSSGNDRHLTTVDVEVNGEPENGAPLLASSARSLRFGTPGYGLGMTSTAMPAIGTGPLSVVAFARRGPGDDGQMIGADTGDHGQLGMIRFRVTDDGAFGLSVRGESISYSASGLVTPDANHMLAAVYDDGTMYFYVDGVAAGSNSYTLGSYDSDPWRVWLGVRARYYGDYYTGDLDHPAIWVGSALGAQDIADLWAASQEGPTLPDPATLTVTRVNGQGDPDPEGTAAKLEWPAPSMPGATHIDIFRGATGGGNPPFDPEQAAPLHRTPVSAEEWTDESAPDAGARYQVFPVVVE